VDVDAEVWTSDAEGGPAGGAHAGERVEHEVAGRVAKGPVLDSVKSVYATTVGKLAEREHKADFHLYRPDWRHHVIAATRTAILYTLRQIHEASGAVPLVVDRDLIAYAADTPDPQAFWPERLRGKLSGAIGGWKPAGVADLPEWGPAFLRRRTAGSYFPYTDAMDAMREPGAST
ncbi:MAG: hypothetical protein WCG47_06550, partial [Dermatophilaceae bacterium]